MDVNAQNLNARDIAARIDPNRFHVSLFSRRKPDQRLMNRPNVTLIKIPPRLGTLTMLRHFLGNYDAIYYSRISRADSMYRWLRKRGFNRTPLISPVQNQMNIVHEPNFPAHLRRYWDDLFSLSDCMVADAPHVAVTAKEAYGVDIPVIVNGVDLPLFARENTRTSVEGVPKVKVLFAGTFQERKHPELVLESAKRRRDVDFVFIGNGPMEGVLKEYSRSEQLVNVTFLGTLPYSEYAEVVKNADIFLFPSRIEGMSKVTLEAAASGMPAIVFDDYHTPVVVDGVTGYQVKTFEEMHEKLNLLIDDPIFRTRMGKAGAEHAKKFEWDRIVPQWENVFEETIGRKMVGRHPHQ